MGRICLVSERRIVGWMSGAAFVCLLGLALPSQLVAQSSSSAEAGPASPTAEGTIEWNFQPVESSEAAGPAALEERWAAPFAVVSRGKPAPRERREVIVARTRSRDVASDSGETAAVVEVVEGEGARPRVAAAARAETGGADDDAASAEVAVEQEESDEEGTGEPGMAPEEGEAVSADADEGSSSSDEDEEEGGAEAAAEDEGEVEELTSDDGEETPPAARGAEVRTHRVAYGETWYGLARRFGVSSRELAAANPDVDPERLRAGTELRIPGARTHTVGRGDTLFGIARRYGVSARAIREANGMEDDIVRLGRTLVIPDEETSP